MHELVAGLVEGNQAAWAALYARVADRLYHYGLIQLGDEANAKDVLQETFLSLYAIRTKLEKVDDLEAYAFIVMRNSVHRNFRSNRRRREQPLDGEACFLAVDGEASEIRQDNREWIAVNLQRLGLEERETIQLKIFADLTFDQIARITQTAIGTVATRYRRAIEKLAKRWDEDFQ